MVAPFDPDGSKGSQGWSEDRFGDRDEEPHIDDLTPAEMNQADEEARKRATEYEIYLEVEEIEHGHERLVRALEGARTWRLDVVRTVHRRVEEVIRVAGEHPDP